MAPTYGIYNNANGLFYYSNCSINAIKSILLTPDRRFIYIHKYLIFFNYNLLIFRSVSTIGQCLINTPNQSLNKPSNLPGKLYDVNTQCKLKLGPFSFYCNGVYSFV